MSTRALTIAGFAGLTVVALFLYLTGRGHRLGLAPLGDLTDSIRRSMPGRFLLALGWAWLGWHLLAR